jgi:hypothetical protein
MDNKWESAGNQLLSEHGLHIATVRKSMSGFAPWEGNGICSPLPKTAKSFAILAHEVGHKALGHNGKGKSCVHEYEAEQFAIQQFKRFGFAMPREVKLRMNRHVAYGLAQALNRGMKDIPKELRPYKKMLRTQWSMGSLVQAKNGIETARCYNVRRYVVEAEDGMYVE